MRGAPCSIISMARRSEIHADPTLRSALETVPEPITLPAPRRRVSAAWAINWWKPKCMAPPCGWPNHSPFHSTFSGRCTRPSRQASPSSSGVTATGAKLEEDLAWTKPKPVFISRGANARRLTSLTCSTRRICASACSAVHPMGTSSTSTANSPSKSMPWASLGSGMS
ncbi:hypothetical protein D3C80_1540530 [compost metagenome]